MIKWLMMKEAAEYLRMGRPTIYKLLREGNLTAYKVGREWRFDAVEIDEWRDDDHDLHLCPEPGRKGHQESLISPAFIVEHDITLFKYWRYERIVRGVLCPDVAAQRRYEETI